MGYEGSHTLSDALPSVIGLMLHAAADGIAMGATAGSNDEGLKAVVFLAIIVHKAVSLGEVWRNQTLACTWTSEILRPSFPSLLVFILSSRLRSASVHS